MTDRDTSAPDAGASISELEADIEKTRHELGDTVEALAAKLDVKANLKSSTDQVKANLKSSAEQTTTNAVAAVSNNWREITIVAVWAALVRLIWKKL
jgi:hypothetical protein